MTAFLIRCHSYFLTGGFLFTLFFLWPNLAQEPSGKPDAPTPKTGQAASSLPTRTTETPPQGKSEPEPEKVPDLPALATKFLEDAKFVGCVEKDCKIVVTNFVLSDGDTSQYGMQLADELSKEMASQRSSFQVVDRRLLQDLLIKDRIPAKSVHWGVLRAIGSALKARFVIIGTTTKIDSDVMQLSAELFDLTAKEWKGYSAVVNVAAPKVSNAILPAEPFAPLPPITPAGNGENLYRSGLDGVSSPKCTYMPNPGYAEEARKFGVNGTITAEAVVTAEGRMENVRIVHGLPGGLNENAIATMQTWRCEPAVKEDKPVAVITELTVDFRLF
jgi:TonB family protein